MFWTIVWAVLAVNVIAGLLWMLAPVLGWAADAAGAELSKARRAELERRARQLALPWYRRDARYWLAR